MKLAYFGSLLLASLALLSQEQAAAVEISAYEADATEAVDATTYGLAEVDAPNKKKG